MTGKLSTDDNVQAAAPDRADLLGAVVPLRERETRDAGPESALDNVVTFVPRRRGQSAAAPAVQVAVADRPVPDAATERRRQLWLLIVASVAVHGALFAAFGREPAPHASIGVITVSAELVLGSQFNAGRSQAPSESEIDSAAAPEPDRPVEERPETAPRAPEEKTEMRDEPRSEPAPEPHSERQTAVQNEPQPVEKTPEPAADAEAAAAVVEEKPVPPAAAERERRPALRQAARPVREDGEGKRERAAPPSLPSRSSNSIGRGRSDADTNYRGLVAAHLARYKQFPSEARSRGEQGTVTVAFSLSGSGNVTSVRLVRGSGSASIDREAQAMVRRASPFPAPPAGRGLSFTVPVNFHLR